MTPSRSTLSGLLISWSTYHCPHTKTTTAPLGGEQSSVWNNHHIYHKYLNNDIWYAMHVCRGGIRSNDHPLSICQNQTNRYQFNARAGTPASIWDTLMIASTKHHQIPNLISNHRGHKCLCFTGHIISNIALCSQTPESNQIISGYPRIIAQRAFHVSMYASNDVC